MGEDGSLGFNGRLIPASQLGSAVRELLQQNPQARIQVSAAGGASMSRFVEVLDTLTAAGLEVEEVPVRIDYRP